VLGYIAATHTLGPVELCRWVVDCWSGLQCARPRQPCCIAQFVRPLWNFSCTRDFNKCRRTEKFYVFCKKIIIIVGVFFIFLVNSCKEGLEDTLRDCIVNKNKFVFVQEKSSQINETLQFKLRQVIMHKWGKNRKKWWFEKIGWIISPQIVWEDILSSYFFKSRVR
jgi:hypothetical protein